jgi:hypothetical protein
MFCHYPGGSWWVTKTLCTQNEANAFSLWNNNLGYQGILECGPYPLNLLPLQSWFTGCICGWVLLETNFRDWGTMSMNWPPCVRYNINRTSYSSNYSYLFNHIRQFTFLHERCVKFNSVLKMFCVLWEWICKWFSVMCLGEWEKIVLLVWSREWNNISSLYQMPGVELLIFHLRTCVKGSQRFL